VDDDPEPFRELGRLLTIAQMNYSWNEAWSLFTQGKGAEALPYMERTAGIAPKNAEVLYDLAVIRLAAGEKEGSLEALEKALALNPNLKQQALGDSDLAGLHDEPGFKKLTE
jgi:Flp pilus assembly protein TadD